MHEIAVRLGRSTSIAAALRSRALVEAARGERGRAVADAREAVDRYAASPLVVDHARALLTLGQVHRRFKEKAAARDALQSALEIFERLGAERFARRARQDLARIGLRPPAGSGLTETERRVAELAGTGKTVRQVADELFVSPKTVEANLTRVYRKLGISGRAELATWLASG
jgi:DNA-binding CsgD family transcriptional regulator